MKRVAIFLPLLCGLMLAIGIIVGSLIGRAKAGSDNRAGDKLNAVLNYVEDNYVDSVNANQLVDQTLSSMLQNLDPHSDYFTAEQITAMNEPMQGNFDGIGIEYNFVRDTLVVIDVIPGGPSEKAGLLEGDRIVKANDTSIVGTFANEKFIRNKLRGPKNTKVVVTLRRPGEAKLLAKTITRGSIPIVSVDGVHMIDEQIGYLRLLRFGETSYEEFLNASDSLLSMGMKKMILDLRGNGGGLLSAATGIADEFLADGKMIVYTKGRMGGEEKTLATPTGRLEKLPMAILIDENSASASEILAGAIQDNDRGVIVGRRSFGKGLVQEERQLFDGSAFRLTIARYYTPTGRCIQKSYSNGIDEYQEEELNRYKHGELINRDSIHFADSLKFKTPGGKIVYGGGGIMPDIFVPLDTIGNSTYLNQMMRKNILTIWALDFVAVKKAELKKQGLSAFIKTFQITDQMISSLVETGKQNGVSPNSEQLKKSRAHFLRFMKGDIARNVWGDDAYIQIVNQDDPTVLAAIEALK
jgi:carboxyl-terminal processing protease